jgi:hypothetical protein
LAREGTVTLNSRKGYIDDCDGGFGNSFLPNKREQEEIEAVIWQEICACDGTFLLDKEGTPCSLD